MPLVTASFTFHTGVAALLPRGGGGFGGEFLRHSCIGRPSLSTRWLSGEEASAVFGVQAGGVRTALRIRVTNKSATDQLADQ